MLKKQPIKKRVSLNLIEDTFKDFQKLCKKFKTSVSRQVDEFIKRELEELQNV